MARFFSYLRPGSIDLTPWQAHFLPEALTTFTLLPTGDQRHALKVAESLRAQNAPVDLVTAGLLHDIGKAVPGIPVRLTDRVAKDLLASFAPRTLSRVAAMPSPRWPLAGVWVLGCHARHGAQLAREWGYPERVAWLIEHHEDKPVTDRQLALLVAMDDGRDPESLALEMPHG